LPYKKSDLLLLLNNEHSCPTTQKRRIHPSVVAIITCGLGNRPEESAWDILPRPKDIPRGLFGTFDSKPIRSTRPSPKALQKV